MNFAPGGFAPGNLAPGRNAQATSTFGWLREATPLLRADDLAALASARRADYAAADPFPHIVLDGLFDPAMLDEVLAVFPGPEAPFWHRFRNDREVKLALDRKDIVPIQVRFLLYTLNGATFVNFLEQLTGIEGLVPDPHWDGGDLELWDRGMTRCVKKVAPLFNRVVVFSTTDHSWHGHPDPLTCPPDRCRRSLALYYYSNGRPSDERSGAHSTSFVRRPGDTFKTGWQRRLTPRVPKTLRRWFGA